MKQVSNQSPATVHKTADPSAPWNAYARSSGRHAQFMLLYSALAGIELMAKKEAVGHKHWLPWVEANCEYSRRTASSYMATADKAMKALGCTSREWATDHIKELISAETESADQERQALLDDIRPPKPEPAPTPAPKPTKPAKPRPTGPRPLFASPKALPKAIERWQATPADARNQFLDSIKDEALAHYQAA